MCGSGPGRTRPHNHRCLRHRGKEQPRLGWTAAVESNSSIRFKCLLHSCLKQGSSRQMQGVIVASLNRQLELQVWCAASASCSSAEAASSVLSTPSESWIARVGRANSSTRQWNSFDTFALLQVFVLREPASKRTSRRRKSSVRSVFSFFSSTRKRHRR